MMEDVEFIRKNVHLGLSCIPACSYTALCDMNMPSMQTEDVSFVKETEKTDFLGCPNENGRENWNRQSAPFFTIRMSLSCNPLNEMAFDIGCKANWCVFDSSLHSFC
ncbi:hypothetical protein AVEN_142518-1 [Araneus ventricosus]|uniref:Uncharacterized protein n=1 Tax=Araneus ventricosus TaxID=182803 RepID=A0A4Y2CHJ3_ARAVE|nr:hypothetical protein AVEN_142518-1 [Araneus ventricosus]